MMIDDAQLLQVKATIWGAAYAAWVAALQAKGWGDIDAIHQTAGENADAAVSDFCNGEDVA